MAGAAPAVDVFIRSYHRDRAWLALALRAIAHYLHGHRRVVVVMPHASRERIGSLADDAGPAVMFHFCPDVADDYLGQQLTKLDADCWTDADVILHVDSDQLFLAPCDVRARLFDGTRLRADHGPGGRRPGSDGWLRCAPGFFGTDFDTLRGRDLTGPPPLAVPREVYGGLRDYCRRRHGLTLADYAARLGADRFCEFSLLRGYALLFAPAACAWGERNPLPECRTFWSRRDTPASIAAHLPAALRAP